MNWYVISDVDFSNIEKNHTHSMILPQANHNGNSKCNSTPVQPKSVFTVKHW